MAAARAIRERPGHYVEPSFSPDGQSVVYRTVRPDGIRSVTPDGEHAGIFVVPVRRRRRRRSSARAASTRSSITPARAIVLPRAARDNRFILASVTRSGGDEVVHFSSENATAIVPSPDGRWVAFAERWHASTSWRFARTGRPVDLAPRATALPVASDLA